MQVIGDNFGFKRWTSIFYGNRLSCAVIRRSGCQKGEHSVNGSEGIAQVYKQNPSCKKMTAFGYLSDPAVVSSCMRHPCRASASGPAAVLPYVGVPV